MTAITGPGVARDVGISAYVYLYPLITMDLTRRQATSVEAGRRPGYGPMNTFSHIREFPDADFKAIVRPNFDTLYSSAWLDLTSGPVIVSAGADPDGRYYELPMYDMWTDAFAVPGQRTTGTGAGNWAVLPPGWQGRLPDGVSRIDAPTPYVWIIGRTQTNGPADYPTVHKIQDAFRLIPLSHWGGGAPQMTVSTDPGLDMVTPPLDQVNSMTAENFFDYGLGLMKLHPPHPTDWSLVAQMRRLGLAAGARVRRPGTRRPKRPERRTRSGAAGDARGLSAPGEGRERLADEHRHDRRVRQLLPQARRHHDGGSGG